MLTLVNINKIYKSNKIDYHSNFKKIIIKTKHSPL